MDELYCEPWDIYTTAYTRWIISACRSMHSQALICMLDESSWYSNDNTAQFLAQSDDYIDLFTRYTAKFGVHFSAIKVAAKWANLVILEHGLRNSGYEAVCAAIVGASETINITTLNWICNTLHLKSIPQYSNLIVTIRDTALSTYNHKFIDLVLSQFKGYTMLMKGIKKIAPMILLRRYSLTKINEYPATFITKQQLGLLDELTTNEVLNMLYDCHRLNPEIDYMYSDFYKYAIDRCWQSNQRIKWSKLPHLSPTLLISALQDKPWMQADCISGIFYYAIYNESYNRSYYPYKTVIELLNAQFAFYKRAKHICVRFHWNKNISMHKLADMFKRHKKNMIYGSANSARTNKHFFDRA
ncbi:hypothetical protein E24_00147 [Faustovirus]|nr:hypothetical protein E24_00147 [Faustovirus]AMN84061.1 hypothetical protein D5a_00146 [Faustovirus]AMN85047.1 hypothetical protein E23_00146 [Faustovirus]